MTREERNTKLKNLITCLKCEESGRECDANCHVQYEAGNMGEIIENLEVISKALEQETIAQERYEDLCEYFGGAKDILKNREDFKGWLERIKWHIRKAAEFYDKYEYKKEPCDDCISRQAVRDTIYAECSGHKLDIDFAKVLLLQRAIKALPPVNPQPCPNAISRSDMLDAIGHGTTYTSEDLQKIIKGLPPVNPLAKDYNTIYYTPQPKTGHWQHYEGMLICSECRTEFYDDIMEYCGDDAPKWCPDCGTKMIEPQESEG